MGSHSWCTMLAIVFIVYFEMFISNVSASYIKKGLCKVKHICVYDYFVSGSIHDKRGKEETVIEATINLKCDSVGVFEGETVVYYCIDVKNISASLSEVTSNNEDSVEQSGMGRETEPELKHENEFKHADSIMSQHFCFVRNENGKIVSVFHPPDESSDVVNFKKTIVSAFQANFAETETEEETDSQSQHTSHYNYTQKGDRKIQHRIVDKVNVTKYSGDVSKQAVDLHSEEDIEVDQDQIIYRSHGQSRVALASELNRDEEEEEEDSADEGPGYVDQDIPLMETDTAYTLELKECIALSENEDTSDETGGPNSRSSPSTDGRWKRSAVKDDLLAKWDQRKHDQLEMAELHKNLPDLHETARRVSRSTDGDRKRKGRDLSTWKRLIWFESKHGPLPGTKSKVFVLTKKLDKIIVSNRSDHSRQLRLLIYSLLSFEGSLTAQKSLMNALEYCNDSDECNAIVMAITMLTSVHSSTMSHLKKHMEDNTHNDQLLLSYATLGRHKNVEDEVLNVLVDELDNLLENNPGVNETEKMVYLIHALGNTGSNKIIPYILPYLSSPDTDIQKVAIDALRTVSRNSSVQNIFKTIVEHTASVDIVSAIVESLIFPFEKSIYFSEKPKNVGESELEQALMRSIVKATIDFSSPELTKLTKTYLKFIGTTIANNLLNEHDNKVINRAGIRKRATSSDWSSSNSTFYGFIAPQSERSADKLNYPCHKALLWVKKVGCSKIHAKLAAVGFSGLGSGHKLFGKVVAQLYVFGCHYTAVEAEYLNHKHAEDGYHLKKYVKICGTVYIKTFIQTCVITLPYDDSWTKTHYCVNLFYRQFSIWIWIGTLNIYIGANVNVYSSMYLTLNRYTATGGTDLAATFSVTGGASVTVLIFWKIGLEITASIDYFVSLQTRLTFCDSTRMQHLQQHNNTKTHVQPCDNTTTQCLQQKVTTQQHGTTPEVCLRIYHGSNGVDVDIYAYYRSKSCRWKSWKFKCTLGGKKKLSLFSSTYALSSLTRCPLFPELCATCTCSP